MPGVAVFSHSPARWQLVAEQVACQGPCGQAADTGPGFPTQPPRLSAPLPACLWDSNDWWSWQMDLNIMPIFWINSWGHFPKRCILLTLSPFAGLINWALPALKWKSNKSKRPRFCALMYIYISMFGPWQPLPLRSGHRGSRRAAGLQGWRGLSARGEMQRAVSHPDAPDPAGRTVSEELSSPSFKALNAGGFLCFPPALCTMLLSWGLRMTSLWQCCSLSKC